MCPISRDKSEWPTSCHYHPQPRICVKGKNQTGQQSYWVIGSREPFCSDQLKNEARNESFFATPSFSDPRYSDERQASEIARARPNPPNSAQSTRHLINRIKNASRASLAIPTPAGAEEARRRFVSNALLESISIEPTQSSEHLRSHPGGDCGRRIRSIGFAASSPRAHHLIHADSLRVTHCPFTNLPERKDSRWSESFEYREEEAVPMGQTEARLPGGVRRMGRTARRADPANSRGAQSDFGVKAPEQWLEGKRRQTESDGEHEVHIFGVGRRYATSRWSGENILRNGASFLRSFRIHLDRQKVPIGATMQRLILPLLRRPVQPRLLASDRMTARTSNAKCYQAILFRGGY